MTLRRTLVLIFIATSCALVGAGLFFGKLAKERGAELFEQVKRSAPIGEKRQTVEASLKAAGLTYEYVAESNFIVSPWLTVGRYMIFWKKKFQFSVHFNKQGLVTSFHTILFDDIP